jgi:ATP-binding cassette subfamily B protein
MPGGLTRTSHKVDKRLRPASDWRWPALRKPEVYLFDDSFSALDLATDARLRAALGLYTKDASVIIIAQRFDDYACRPDPVLEGGETVGLGTHEQLLATCPTHAEIVESQVGGGQRHEFPT